MVRDVLIGHLTIQGVKFLNESCVVSSDLRNHDLIIGRSWFADHKALIDCGTNKLVWKEVPTSAPITKDIVIDLDNVNPQKVDPVHQSDVYKRDREFRAEDKRRLDGKAGQRIAAISSARLALPDSTFACDRTSSYKKMNAALHFIQTQVDSPRADTSSSACSQRIDTPGLTLSASLINVAALRLWTRRSRTKRDCYVGSVSLQEVDKLIDVRREQRLQRQLPSDEQDDIRELIAKKLPAYLQGFADVCSKVRSNDLPPHHRIEILDGQGKPPAMSPLYHMSMEHLQLLKDYLQDALQKGFIQKTKAPYASPVLFAKKPGGGWRFCVDYRRLNSRTQIDPYPLPLIDEVLDKLQGATVFTKVDVRQAFHRIRMHPDSVPLTAFRTRYGLYEYNVLPFGLCNGPATFQRYINEVLFDLLDECCTAYVDDILIYSHDPLEHQAHVQQVLQRLREAGLQIDIKKSEFSVTQTKFLGFIISTQGIAVDPDKTEVIRQWQVPESVKGVQSFLGFCNFYRRFIRGYGQIALPLIRLTKKGQPWYWDDAQEEAFVRLKEALVSAPILVHFDPLKETVLETDASNGVIAGVLSQRHGEFLHPVAFFSKGMTPAEMRYDIHDKEMLAIALSLQKYRADLQAVRQPFLIITDHKALEYFGEKRQLNDRQLRWTLLLADFSYRITYRPGKQNILADTLTRKLQDLKTQKAIKEASRTEQLISDEALTSPPLGVDLAPIDAAPEDPATTAPVRPQGYDLVDLILKANRDSQATPEASPFWDLAAASQRGWERTDSGLLLRNKALFVPLTDTFLRTLLIEEVHARAPTAHPGRNKTKSLLLAQYYWPNAGADIERYIANCTTCRRSHVPRDKTPGLLKPLPIPERPWAHLHMDFTSMPPDRKGFNEVLVFCSSAA